MGSRSRTGTGVHPLTTPDPVITPQPENRGPMARKVFFSFHYQRDIRRIVQVRNAWVVRAQGESQPFMDKAEWESIKRSGTAEVERWIERQLSGTSVTVVLIGAETATRRWVLHELRRSHALGKGILGVRIHNVKDPQTGTDSMGLNPLGLVSVNKDGRSVPMSSLYSTYDWVNDNGRDNIAGWIETAARQVGR